MTDFYDFVQQVKQANDIVAVVGSFLELRQRGSNYFARCPFHGEKTASFSVNRNKQIFKCFGCGESGDVVKFVQMYESCTFYEAVEILAKRAGLKMPETEFQKRDKAYEEKKKKKDLYLEICKQTATFYWKNFYAPQGAVARQYMEKRGYSAETLKKFGIGYSPDRFSLVNFLEKKGFSHEDCLKCGVLQTNSNGSVFDALSERLIVPIFNINGKVIAFGGRGLDEKTISFGKYKNTGDAPQFDKSSNLFAIHLAKEQKQQSQLPNLVVVEGYMDVIAMHQAGFCRAVASMGTSLTENQAKLASRLTDNVYICYDGDAAGQKATARALDILDKAGLEVKAITVPENLDPDEYILKYGAAAFEKLIDQALSMPDYKLMLLEKAFPINSSDPAKRNNALPKYVKGAVKMLQQLDDVRQAQYVAAVSVKTGYSQEYLVRKIQQESTEEAEPTTTLSSETKAKYFVAACMLSNQPYANLADKPYCQTAFLSNLFDYLFDCKTRGITPQTDMMYTVCPDATQAEYNEIVNVDFSAERQDKNKQYFEECKKIIVVERLKTEREQLLKQIKANPQDTTLLTKIAELNRKINA